MYVGVVGARARNSDVYTFFDLARIRGSSKGSHRKVIAGTVSDLGKRIGRARGDKDDVCPSAEFYVQDWITNLIVRL